MSDQKKIYCDCLLMAVVQAQDADAAYDYLGKVGCYVTRLPSVGGFLSQRNATLLIGTSCDRRGMVIEELRKHCRERIEYIAVPLESAPMPVATPTPIPVGGATIFTIPIEHFEEV